MTGGGSRAPVFAPNPVGDGPSAATNNTFALNAPILASYPSRAWLRAEEGTVGGPRYPYQQLRSVSLETYFKGRFSVTSGLERVQQRVDRELPTVMVPHAQHGEPLTLRPFQMRDDE